MNGLKDRVVMITGASSGFGKEAAKMCVGLGAKVVLGARREKNLQELCDELGSDSSTYKVADVTSKEQMHALAEHGIKTFGRIDSLVNNAGVMPLSLLQKGRTDEWDQMIDVNIKGVLYGIDSVYSHMLERESGQIINISSVAGKRVMPGSAVYSGTKYAVRAISEGLRLESSGQASSYLHIPWGIHNRACILNQR
jgi:NADP-dependent 3-hydroxy acid dehydrogenase YdfG